MFTKLNRSLRRLLKKRRLDRGLLFTRDNIRIDREIFYEDYGINAYVEVWFDAEKKFGLHLPGDDYVNVYAYINPDTGDVYVTYVICYADGSIDNEHKCKGLTQGEKALIREMVNEVSLRDTMMTAEDYWYRCGFGKAGGECVESH